MYCARVLLSSLNKSNPNKLPNLCIPFCPVELQYQALILIINHRTRFANLRSKLLLLLVLVLEVQIHTVLVGNVDPSGRFDVVHPNDTAGVRIAMGCVVDRPTTQILGFLILQIPPISGIQNTIGVDGTATNGEHLTRGACAFRIDVVQLGTLPDGIDTF